MTSSRRLLAGLAGTGVALALMGSNWGAPADADFSWRQSLPVRYESPSIGPIGGTEIRAIVSMDGMLYAANGYWRDTQQNDARIPGPQILALDRPDGAWRVDLGGLDQRVSAHGPLRYQAIGALFCGRFHTDASGRVLPNPQSVLFASLWDRIGSLTILTKAGKAGTWQWTSLAASAPRRSQVRSFGMHRDRVTGVDEVFAGTNPLGIVAGTFDTAVPSHIRWNPRPEPWLGLSQDEVSDLRIMSFAEANHHLYATAGWSIFERQDGTNPGWRRVFTWPGGTVVGGGGLRGVTAIPNPSGSGEVLLASVNANPLLLIRIDPQDGFRYVVDLNVSDFLTRALHARATYGIAAYNDMTVYGPAANPSLLIGFEIWTPGVDTAGERGKNAEGRFLIRDSQGQYALREIIDPSVTPRPALIATRTLAISPFAADPPGTIYAGGFDAGNTEPHNTAWLYKGIPQSPKGLEP